MEKIGVIAIFTSEIIYWSSVTLACLLGAMSPGPSVAVVINYAMSGNKWVGLCCAWGHGIAIALYAFISAFGLLIVFEKSLLVFNFLQLAGIAVLLTLGIKLFNAQTSLISISDRPLSQSFWRAARDGFLVAFVNPKVMLFFTALFSQFLYQGMSVTQKLGLVFVASSVDALWYSIVAFLVIQTTTLEKLHQYSLIISKLFGGLLIFYCIYFLQAILRTVTLNFL